MPTNPPTMVEQFFRQLLQVDVQLCLVCGSDREPHNERLFRTKNRASAFVIAHESNLKKCGLSVAAKKQKSGPESNVNKIDYNGKFFVGNLTKMNSDLYALTIRALIHGQHPDESHSKVDCKSYQMVEHLKQSVNFNEEFHHKILTENENCIQYSLEISTDSQQKNQRFLLQISRSDDGHCAMQEAVISTDMESTVELRYGKCSLVRVFSTQFDTNEEPTHKKLSLQKSGSFLKRWCRINGRANALLNLKVKHLTVDQISKFPLNSNPKSTLFFKLRQNHTLGKELKILNLSEFKHLIKCFYFLVLENKIAWDFVFDVLKSVAVFYDFPTPTWKLMLLGVVLEESFDEEKTMEHFSLIVQRYFQQLRCATLSKSSKALESALFLSTQLLQFTEIYLKSSPTDVFFPVFTQQPSHIAFYLVSNQLSSILDVVHLSLWDASEQTAQIQTKLSLLFKKKLQRSVGSWLHDSLAPSKGLALTSGTLCNVVDELHVVLRLCTPLYQELFQKVWLSYLKTVVEIIEDPLCHLCQETLLVEVNALNENPHDSAKLLEFSKESMKLFDALRQLVEFVTSQGQVTRLQKFEHWFETSAIFWTSNWRTLYLGFIKKSVDSVESGEHTPCDLAEVDLKKCDVELHESTINCLAFCKALCDDFIRLQIHNVDLCLICVLQIIPILTDCLNSFAVQLFQQLKQNTTMCNMLKTANGIEHACNHLLSNFERFLQLSNFLSQFETHEREQIVSAIRRLMTSTEKRCKQLSTSIVNSMCTQNFTVLKKYCAQVVSAGEPITRRRLRSYVTQVFTSDGADQLLLFLDKLCTNFKYTLLPRLNSAAMDCLWVEIRSALSEQLLEGQPAEYYKQINKDCETICRTIGINWAKDNGPLREKLHLNRAETKELILQYYSKLCDLTTNSRPIEGTARVHLRVGYVRTTNRQILLHIYVLCAYDVPILDTLTKSSDPYVRLELYPRYLFPLNQFPAQTSETRKQTLQPKWNQAFEISVPEDYFFINGVCLCVTVLDYDIVSYNDLAGQAMYPLASIAKLKSLSSKHLPKPIVLPLIFPSHPLQYDEHFKILEKRANKDDKLAREVVCYERYLRSYRILPPESSQVFEWYQRGKIRHICRIFDL